MLPLFYVNPKIKQLCMRALPLAKYTSMLLLATKDPYINIIHPPHQPRTRTSLQVAPFERGAAKSTS